MIISLSTTIQSIQNLIIFTLLSEHKTITYPLASQRFSQIIRILYHSVLADKTDKFWIEMKAICISFQKQFIDRGITSGVKG